MRRSGLFFLSIVFLGGIVLACVLGMTIPVSAAEGVPEYLSKGRRDPFAPLVRDGKIITPPSSDETRRLATGAPSLRGILWDQGGRSIALLDDGEFQSGDNVRGYVIQQINKNEVILSRGSESLVLRLEAEGLPPGSPVQGRMGGESP